LFKGEKTSVFWTGLIILGLASYFLFMMLWDAAVQIWRGYGGISYRGLVPPLFGGIVFLLIGLSMMISGRKRKAEKGLAEDRPVGGVVYCFACGTPNAQDAVYCKKCGQQLATG
jgi:ribosomal protein L40E